MDLPRVAVDDAGLAGEVVGRGGSGNEKDGGGNDRIGAHNPRFPRRGESNQHQGEDMFAAQSPAFARIHIGCARSDGAEGRAARDGEDHKREKVGRLGEYVGELSKPLMRQGGRVTPFKTSPRTWPQRDSECRDFCCNSVDKHFRSTGGHLRNLQDRIILANYQVR